MPTAFLFPGLFFWPHISVTSIGTEMWVHGHCNWTIADIHLIFYLTNFSLKELSTTLTLDRAISPAPHIGVRFIGGSGVKRYSTPAARGMHTML